MREELVFAFGAEHGEQFQVFHGMIARCGGGHVPETIRQLEALSKMLPCGQMIPETDIPGRQLTTPGIVWVPEHEQAIVRAILGLTQQLALQ